MKKEVNYNIITRQALQRLMKFTLMNVTGSISLLRNYLSSITLKTLNLFIPLKVFRHVEEKLKIQKVTK